MTCFQLVRFSIVFAEIFFHDQYLRLIRRKRDRFCLHLQKSFPKIRDPASQIYMLFLQNFWIYRKDDIFCILPAKLGLVGFLVGIPSHATMHADLRAKVFSHCAKVKSTCVWNPKFWKECVSLKNRLFRISDHNSWIPGLICIEFWLGNSV